MGAKAGAGTFIVKSKLDPYRHAIARHDETENAMDKDRVKGSGKQVKGDLKDKAGELLGDKKMQGEGKADKAEGKVQNAVGGIKDALKGKH